LKNSQKTDKLQPDNNIDLTEDIQLVLQCAQALGGYFGLVAIVNFICGKKNDKLSKYTTHKLYGKGDYNTETFWKALGNYFYKNIPKLMRIFIKYNTILWSSR